MDNLRPGHFDFEGQENSFEELLRESSYSIDFGNVSLNDNQFNSHIGSICPILDTEISAISLDELDHNSLASEDIFAVGTSDEFSIRTSYPLNYLETEIDPLTGRQEARSLDIFDWEQENNQENTIFYQALSEVFARFVQLNNNEAALAIFRKSFGEGLCADDVQTAISQLINAEAEIDFYITSGSELGADGGFASEEHTIYLAQEFLVENAANSEVVVKLLLEEIGHYFDSQFNEEDTPGDEGAIFAALVLGEELDESKLERLQAEDDSAVVNLGGKTIAIERSDILSLSEGFISIEEELTDTDNINLTLDGSYSDDYELTDVIAGEFITIELTSDDFDTYLQLVDADTEEIIDENDDFGYELDSRLSFTAVEGINYLVRVSGYDEYELGIYTLEISSSLEAPDLPDLIITDVQISPPSLINDSLPGSTNDIISVSINDTISVSWTVENIENTSAFGYWEDEIYFSTDPFLDDDDIYLNYEELDYEVIPLESGEEYTFELDVVIPHSTANSSYLLFVVDAYNDLGESDESNNLNNIS